MDLEKFPPDDRQTLEEFFNYLKATGKCTGTWDAYQYSLSRVRGQLPSPLRGGFQVGYGGGYRRPEG